jgi:hypothetical protein
MMVAFLHAVGIISDDGDWGGVVRGGLEWWAMVVPGILA